MLYLPRNPIAGVWNDARGREQARPTSATREFDRLQQPTACANAANQENYLTQSTSQAGDDSRSARATLLQAVTQIPALAGQTTKQSYLDRLQIDDLPVQLFAIFGLCDGGERLSPQVLKTAMGLAGRSAQLRQRLTPQLIRTCRFDHVAWLIDIERRESSKTQDLHQRLILARLHNDYREQIALCELTYLQTGDSAYVAEAATIAREQLPWQVALPLAIRLIFITTRAIEHALITTLQMLSNSGAQKEFATLAQLIVSMNTHNVARAYGLAQLQFWRGEYQQCVDFLTTSKALAATEGMSPLLLNLAARAAEAKGDYRQAAIWFDKQNRVESNRKYNAADYLKAMNAEARIKVSDLPQDSRKDYFVMTGFPRSGTTLLENTLNAHPLIATCEETSSLAGSFATAHASTDLAGVPTTMRERLLLHRELYYQSLDRFVSKEDVKVVIDKTPIMSSHIKYMEQLFPEKRYLFSIRHPYDVVLSNWKQTYRQNLAMAAFNDIYDACVLYDRVMSDWFEVFPTPSNRVFYVRYDELVNDFRKVVEGALSFVGLDWTDDLMQFAAHSAKRSVRTPSYANVRKGLTIGVQTSWQNFEFVFDQRCKVLLDPWVRRFGYLD
jgi:tetratricopeptide (TPR) repeat protein